MIYKYATIHRSGYDDAQLIYVKEWRLFGILVFRQTRDINGFKLK